MYFSKLCFLLCMPFSSSISMSTNHRRLLLLVHCNMGWAVQLAFASIVPATQQHPWCLHPNVCCHHSGGYNPHTPSYVDTHAPYVTFRIQQGAYLAMEASLCDVSLQGSIPWEEGIHIVSVLSLNRSARLFNPIANTWTFPVFNLASILHTLAWPCLSLLYLLLA